MFDIGWVEMMMVVIVMIIVIGPKDLPKVLYTIGRWVGNVRSVSRHFQESLEEAARESGLDRFRDDIRSVRDIDVEREMGKAIDPEGDFLAGVNRPDDGTSGNRRPLPQPDGSEKTVAPNHSASDSPAGQKSAGQKSDGNIQ